MRVRARILAVLALASAGVGAFGYGVAQAQTAPAGSGTGAGTQNSAAVGLQRTANLTPAEMLTQSKAVVSRVDSAQGQVRQMLEKARSDRDVVKTLCLNDKLNQVDVAKRSATARAQSLASATQLNDRDLAAHEFTLLVVLKDKVEKLVAQANQCVGSEVGIIGDTTVTATTDPTTPDDLNTPNVAGIFPGIFTEPPTSQSPSM